MRLGEAGAYAAANFCFDFSIVFWSRVDLPKSSLVLSNNKSASAKVGSNSRGIRKAKMCAFCQPSDSALRVVVLLCKKVTTVDVPHVAKVFDRHFVAIQSIGI